MTRSATILFLSFLVLAPCSLLVAGDAVAVGYNRDGLWTSVTYYSSATPKGGRDYKDEAGAREAALQDLHKRGDIETMRWEILSSSNSTGFTAVGRGSNASNKDANVVGRGKTQTEADQNAIAELTKLGATKGQKIVYRYFSHGADGK